jgi:hypothetical protein
MATVGSIVTKDYEPAAQKFVQQASAEHLQKIAAGTILARHPLVTKPQGTAEEKTESLRKLISHEMRRHADFRGMVIRLLAKEGLVTASPKEAKKEAPSGKEAKKEKEAPAAAKEGASEGQEKKPKKEKRPEQAAAAGKPEGGADKPKGEPKS